MKEVLRVADRLLDRFGRKLVSLWTGLPQDVVDTEIDRIEGEREQWRQDIISHARGSQQEQPQEPGEGQQ